MPLYAVLDSHSSWSAMWSAALLAVALFFLYTALDRF